MARYTKLNIDDIEDSAPRFGLAPGLEARFGRRPLESEIVAVSRETLAPGFRVPFGHRHRDQEEIDVVLRGATIKIDDEISTCARATSSASAAESGAAPRAETEGLQDLAVGAPVSDEDDSEIEQGWWSD